MRAKDAPRLVCPHALFLRPAHRDGRQRGRRLGSAFLLANAANLSPTQGTTYLYIPGSLTRRSLKPSAQRCKRAKILTHR